MFDTITIRNDTKDTYKVAVSKTGMFESESNYEIAPGGSEGWSRNPANGPVCIFVKKSTFMGAIGEAMISSALAQANGEIPDKDMLGKLGADVIRVHVGNYTVSQLLKALGK